MGQYRPKQFFKEFENIYGDIQKEEVSPYEALKPEYDTTGYSKLFNKEKTQCEESSDPAWREILRSSLYLGAYLEEELSRNANNVMTKEMIQAVHLALYNGSYEGWGDTAIEFILSETWKRGQEFADLYYGQESKMSKLVKLVRTMKSDEAYHMYQAFEEEKQNTPKEQQIELRGRYLAGILKSEDNMAYLQENTENEIVQEMVNEIPLLKGVTKGKLSEIFNVASAKIDFTNKQQKLESKKIAVEAQKKAMEVFGRNDMPESGKKAAGKTQFNDTENNSTVYNRAYMYTMHKLKSKENLK